MNLLLCLSLCLTLVAAAPNATYPDFGPWDDLLTSGVINATGQLAGISLHTVNYTELAAQPQLNTTLVELAKEWPTETWTEAQFKAFYINAYNVLAINTIVEHPCEEDLFGECGALPGIRQASSVLAGAIWGKQAGMLAGKNVTLDEVEMTLRRPSKNGFKNFTEDSRIHSAIVCASISCPNLYIGAFFPDKVDEQLNETMTNFMANDKKGFRYDNISSTVTLSKIFDFFPDDFKPTPIDFVMPYLPKDGQEYVKKHKKDIKIAFFQYNWDLNGEGMPCEHSRPCFSGLDLIITGSALGCVAVLFLCCFCVKKKKSFDYETV